MGLVRLIMPVSQAKALSEGYVARCRQGLERVGYTVEVLALFDPHRPRPDDPSADLWRWERGDCVGLSSALVVDPSDSDASSAVDALVVLDPHLDYHPDDVVRIAEPLTQGTADIAFAARNTSGSPVRTSAGSRVAGWAMKTAARRLFGRSDVVPGLIALTPDVARVAAESFQPIGSRFVTDLLRHSKGRRVEVPVRVESAAGARALNLNDLRYLKRLADDRFGNASRLIQFCVVGASGMVVDLTCYAAFQPIFSRTWLAGHRTPVVNFPLDFAAAGALAIAIALTWNFSLNRRLTFSYARHGSLIRQYLTYALSNSLGIALSFSLRLYLPEHVAFFQRHRLAAAVVGIVTATGISFSMARWLVFSRRSVARDLARAEARATASTQVVSTSTTS